MSTNNLSKQLFHKHLYHGTDAELKPGDIVTPQDDDTHAYATNDPFFAGDYGHVYKVEPVDKKDLTRFKHEDSEATHYMSRKGFKVIE